MPRECWVCHLWKHSRSSWTGFWVTCSSWRCLYSWQGSWSTWPLKVPSNPNSFMIVRFYNAADLFSAVWAQQVHKHTTSRATGYSWQGVKTEENRQKETRISLDLLWHSSFSPKAKISSFYHHYTSFAGYFCWANFFLVHSNNWQCISRLHSLLLFGKEHIICFLFALQQKCCRKMQRKKKNLPWIDVQIASLIWHISCHACNWWF